MHSPLAHASVLAICELQGHHRLELKCEAVVGEQSSHRVRAAVAPAVHLEQPEVRCAGRGRSVCWLLGMGRDATVLLPLPLGQTVVAGAAWASTADALLPWGLVSAQVVAMGGEDCRVHVYDISRGKKQPPAMLAQLQVGPEGVGLGLWGLSSKASGGERIESIVRSLWP